MNLLLRGGRLIDPATSHDGIADVLVVDGAIAEIGRGLSSKGRVIDLGGLVVGIQHAGTKKGGLASLQMQRHRDVQPG